MLAAARFYPLTRKALGTPAFTQVPTPAEKLKKLVRRNTRNAGCTQVPAPAEKLKKLVRTPAAFCRSEQSQLVISTHLSSAISVCA